MAGCCNGIAKGVGLGRVLAWKRGGKTVSERGHHLSRRGWLSIFATSALLVAIVVALPGVSSARAAVKQYESTITPTSVSGGSTGLPFQVTIFNCGQTIPPGSRCTATSTIQLGTAQILVPSRFTITVPAGSSLPATSNRNWAASWDGTYIQAHAVTGNDKLNSGDSVTISFTANVSGCSTTGSPYQFTTTAWGSTPDHAGEAFSPLAQPSVAVSGCVLAPGDNTTGPNGTNITNDSDVTVGVSFGGSLTCDNQRWNDGFRLPDEVNITPPASLPTNGPPKFFTFRFDATADSSFYLICYSRLDSGQGIILPLCYPGGGEPLNGPPCVDQQYRDVATNKVTIRIKVPPEDPRAH
jgi:hypothetical protein